VAVRARGRRKGIVDWKNILRLVIVDDRKME